MNILVCDDNVVNRQLIGAYLLKMGHTPLYAENGNEAIKVFIDRSPDLVIIDVEMPGMNGYEATRAIRQSNNHYSQWTPIIFLSSHIDDESIVKGIDAGGDDYLTKPVSISVLKAKIHAMHRLVDMRKQLIDFSIQLHVANEKLKESNQLLSELSLQDRLTRLGNRRAFEEHIAREFRTALRVKNNISLLMIDVDFFKSFNDVYGHQTGDDCLFQVATVLKNTVHRGSDFPARYGGEEFALILPDTPLIGAMSVAERVLKGVENLQIKNPHIPNGILTISIGVSSCVPDENITVSNLIEAADKALYQAKNAGRNQIMCGKISNKHKKVG